MCVLGGALKKNGDGRDLKLSGRYFKKTKLVLPLVSMLKIKPFWDSPRARKEGGYKGEEVVQGIHTKSEFGCRLIGRR